MKSVTVVALLLFVAVVALSQQPPAAKGSISGKLVPEYTGLNVSLARYTHDDNGEIQLVSFKTARSSSEIGKFGEYRFDDVEPGEYYVHATPAGLSGRAGNDAEDFLSRDGRSWKGDENSAAGGGEPDARCPQFLFRANVRSSSPPDRCNRGSEPE